MDPIASDADQHVIEVLVDLEKPEELPNDDQKVGEELKLTESTQAIHNTDSDINGDVRTSNAQNVAEVDGENGEVAESLTSNQDTSCRPKRNAKPSSKSIDNRIQSDKAKLEKLWGKVLIALSSLQASPDSLGELRSAITKVRSNFHEYQVLWFSYIDFLAYVGTPQCQQERETVQDIMNNHKLFTETAIAQGNERKKELLSEMGSVRSSSRVSSVSSAAVRAQARAEAAAAIKKAEMQKKRSLLESQSAMLIQQEELALSRRKMDEKARIEQLRLEEEAEIAVAKIKAIDDELGLKSELRQLNLPEDNVDQRVRHYVENQCSGTLGNDQHHNQLSQQVPLQTQRTSHPRPLDPTTATFHPQTHQISPPPKPSQDITSYIEFMARRELIANKIEKFNDKPENYHVWKESFQNMIRNVCVTPSEELSLIMEYTTNESKKLVQRLRNAYVRNPSDGVAEVWKKLSERYGSNLVLTKVHLDKLTNFPKFGHKDNKRLQEFGDLLLELECAKNDGSLQGLRILDEPIYLKPAIAKLPGDIQGRWQRHAFRYKNDHRVDYPPFGDFAKFIQDISLERNDPNLMLDTPEKEIMPPRNHGPKPRQTYRTDIKEPEADGEEATDPSKWCVLHQKPHPLNKCRAFRAKPLEERKSLLRQYRICYRCVASTTHLAKDCKSTTKCTECQSERHVEALHAGKPLRLNAQGGEQKHDEHQNEGHGERHGGEPEHVTAKCTDLCGDKPGGRSCSKICLANIYEKSHPERKIRAYVVIDDQSNCSLAKSQLFEQLNIDGEAVSYTLRTCAGTNQLEGRRAKDLIIESLDGRKTHPLPTVIECNAIPDSKEEIPTPAVATAHPHLRPIADKIPDVSYETDILLLIGRDLPSLHKVHESRNGRGNSPWAQRLDLGWVILGNVCLNGAHPTDVSSYKTHVLQNGRPSILEPCPNSFFIKQDSTPDEVCASGAERKESFAQGRFEDGIARNIFARTKNDDRPGLSVEDKRFIDIMEHGMVKNDSGNWVAPLPFRHEVKKLPSSREEAYKRFKSMRKTLDRKPLMKQHYFDFMKKIFENAHAEPVPLKDIASSKPCWYLPHFGVYHPQKPEKIRVVFDSAAESDRVSLNKSLLSGPDLANSLLGVLLRFRQNSTAFVADIEQMFHSFIVKEDHRDFLRFLWYEDNNPDGKVMEYRMKVHLFGNTSSPAVATFGLRKTAQVGEAEFGSDAKGFVVNDFYVDDGLKSTAGSEQAIDLLQRTQAMLATANLRLHKIASNDPKVTHAFPTEDRASDLRNLDLNQDTTPIQRSLGVSWDLGTDTFTFRVALGNRPFTRRGVLSVTNSLYDPLGIAAPVLIRAKSLLRGMSANLKERQLEEWDKPLPPEYKPAWDEWCKSLSDLQHVKVPRAYTTATSLEESRPVELHTFCDASVQGIAAVSYLKTIQPDGQVQVSFVFGKAKLAPPHATTIPRLELCAAVLAVEITEIIMQERVVRPDSITYHSDSKVVLGYIANEIRRFYVYVSNRVERIRKSSSPDQWRYVPTQHNPADLATRTVKARDLGNSMWLSGPDFLREQTKPSNIEEKPNSLELHASDPEVRPELKTLTTKMEKRQPVLQSSRFTRFSLWPSLVRAISLLIMVARSYQARANGIVVLQTKEHLPANMAATSIVEARKRAEIVIIKSSQYEAFAKDIECIRNGKKLVKPSVLLKLSPIVDEEGLLRVGGRLDRADLTNEERHPLILPGSHHVTSLIVQHLHNEVKHQGRHFTQGIVRAKGYWIVGGKRIVSKVIHNCLKCRKLRGKQQHQKMADLPAERLNPAPPFTFVGLDVFGPWQVVARRTRGGVSCNKRWAVIFTCLSIRAIHIELIESLDTSSFINALRRFLAIRGPVAQLRSDCGTNFVGARNELDAALKEMDKRAIDTYLNRERCEWMFNSPHASHAGGVWERMIGVSRKILDSMLADLGPRQLTHEVLSTIMAEVTAIVNNRPLVPVSNDPTMPDILTPSTLLTQKFTTLKATPGKFTQTDLCLHNKQWRQVQHLANIFWSRWRKEFLPMLQPRRKHRTLQRAIWSCYAQRKFRETSGPSPE